MSRIALVVFAFVLVSVLTGMPAPTAKAAATQPAAPPSPPEPEVLDWLDRIQAKSREIKTFQAKLIYDSNQGLVGDKQRRFGAVLFLAGPPKKFDIHFDSVLVDERKDPLDDSFIYDGQWLVERNGKDKTFTKRQLVPPQAVGTPGIPGTPVAQSLPGVDPLDSGDGPFVLPITTDKDRLLKRFDIVLAKPDKNDPPNTVHLKLTPRAGRKSNLTSVDMWYDRDSLLPVRVMTMDDSEHESVIQVMKVKINEKVKADDFDTSEPTGEGWHVEVTPWEDSH